jgi:hypothetical protein
MAGALPKFKHGPVSYQVASAVSGGQLVMPNSTTAGDVKVKAATAAATTVLGVAATDAAPLTEPALPTGTDDNNPLLESSALMPNTAVYNHVVINVTYTGAANFGELLVAGASGQVTAYTAGTSTYDTVVGRCVQPGGVAAAGVGLMFVNV